MLAPLPTQPQRAHTFPLDLTMSLLAPGADSAAASPCLPWWPPRGRASHAWLGWLVPGLPAGCCGHQGVCVRLSPAGLPVCPWGCRGTGVQMSVSLCVVRVHVWPAHGLPCTHVCTAACLIGSIGTM